MKLETQNLSNIHNLINVENLLTNTLNVKLPDLIRNLLDFNKKKSCLSLQDN